TASGSSSHVSGYSAGTGASITQSLVNNSTAIETVTYTVIPSVGGCNGSIYTVLETVNPVPVATSSGNQSFCQSGTTSITLSASTSAAITDYSWTAGGSSANVTGYSNGIGASIAQTLTNTGASIETVTYTVTPSVAGCNGNTFTVTVTLTPIPNATSSGNQNFCHTGTTAISLTSATDPLTVYHWTASGSSSHVSGYSAGTGVSIAQSLVNNSTGIEIVTYIVTPSVGSCIGSTFTVLETVNPIPVASAATGIIICDGSSANLSLNTNVSAGTGTSFNWTSSVTYGTVAGNTDCSSNCGNVIADLLANTSNVHGDVTYVITPTANGCTGNSITSVVTVGALPATPGAITGPAVVCSMTSAIYSIAAVPEATNYVWTVPSPMTITSGTGTTSIHVTVPAGTVLGNITVRAQNSCGYSLGTTSLAITKKPGTPGAISGPTSLCGMTTANYSIAPVFGVAATNGYSWTLPTGITIASGSGTNSINVNIATTFVAGNVTVAAVNACGNIPGTSMAVYGKAPAASTAIAGLTSVCGATTITYTAAAIVGATSYAWTLPAGFTQVSASGSSITVLNTGVAAGSSISVKGVNVCGIGAIKTLALSIATGTPGVITGPTVTCGMSSAAYSVAPVAGATSYNWTLPAGASISAGLGTNSIVASFTSGIAGTVSVMANNGCSNSVARTLAVSKVPATPGAITGPTVICGLGTAAYSIAPVTGATNYLWVAPAGVSIASGQGTTSIVVNVATTAFASGLIRVYAQTTCGNSVYSGLTFGACASPTEMNIAVEDKDNMFSTLYPNPTANEFNIDVTTSVDRAVVVEVYDVLGNVVKHELHQLVSGTSTMKTNIEEYKNGIYFVRVLDVDNNVLYTQRVVKQ
ncbi:MAG: PKD-like domain-containing protein, partial [Bacteroidota bacterium]